LGRYTWNSIKRFLDIDQGNYQRRTAVILKIELEDGRIVQQGVDCYHSATDKIANLKKKLKGAHDVLVCSYTDTYFKE
jgi:hypothetical protein